MRWSLLGVACLSRLWACSACRDGEPQCYGQNPTISELVERAPSAAAPLSPPPAPASEQVVYISPSIFKSSFNEAIASIRGAGRQFQRFLRRLQKLLVRPSGSVIGNGRGLACAFLRQVGKCVQFQCTQSADASNTRLELSLRSNQDAIDPFHPEIGRAHV